MEEWDIDLNVPMDESDEIRKRAPELFVRHYHTGSRTSSTLCGEEGVYKPTDMWSEVDCPNCKAMTEKIAVITPRYKEPIALATRMLAWAPVMAKSHPDWIFYYEEETSD